MKREISVKLLKVFIILIAAGFMMNGVAFAGGITNDSKTPVNVSLPGIGKKKAETIIAYREKNGKFNEIEDIKKVEGIGKETLEKIKNYIVLK